MGNNSGGKLGHGDHLERGTVRLIRTLKVCFTSWLNFKKIYLFQVVVCFVCYMHVCLLDNTRPFLYILIDTRFSFLIHSHSHLQPHVQIGSQFTNNKTPLDWGYSCYTPFVCLSMRKRLATSRECFSFWFNHRFLSTRSHSHFLTSVSFTDRGSDCADILRKRSCDCSWPSFAAVDVGLEYSGSMYEFYFCSPKGSCFLMRETH